MVNVYKIFFGFSFFRFKERYISKNSIIKKIKQNRAVLIFLHPKINNKEIKKIFLKKWSDIFDQLNWNVVFLDKSIFNKWWKKFSEKNDLYNHYFIFITDKNIGIREYKTILLTTPKTFFLKNPEKTLLKDEKKSNHLFVGIYDTRRY